MIRSVVAAAVAIMAVAAPLGASAQTANASPASGTGAGGSTVIRTAPSGGATIPNPGQPQVGAPTPLERHEEQKSQKDMTICKGC